jgi:hypothetical protein
MAMESLHITTGLPRLPRLQGRLLGKAHTTQRTWMRPVYAALLGICTALERRTASERHPAERVERALTFLLGLAETGPKPWGGPVDTDTFRTRTAPAPGWIMEQTQGPDRVAVVLLCDGNVLWRCEATQDHTIYTPFGVDLLPADWHVLANGVVAALVPHRSADRAQDTRALDGLLRMLG